MRVCTFCAATIEQNTKINQLFNNKIHQNNKAFWVAVYIIECWQSCAKEFFTHARLFNAPWLLEKIECKSRIKGERLSFNSVHGKGWAWRVFVILNEIYPRCDKPLALSKRIFRLASRTLPRRTINYNVKCYFFFSFLFYFIFCYSRSNWWSWAPRRRQGATQRNTFLNFAPLNWWAATLDIPAHSRISVLIVICHLGKTDRFRNHQQYIVNV